MRKILFLLFLTLLLHSCKSETEVTFENIPLQFYQPSNFPKPSYDVSRNQPTKAGFELGKKLFYDGRLAKDGVISCGFCHEQGFAFTHHGHTVSHGVGGGLGFRNAQPIQNLAFQDEFMWDGAALHLDLQPIIPITSEVEMNETMPSIIKKIEKDAEYRRLFYRAFQDGKIDSKNILKALSQFMIMMTSANSKYDKYVRNELGGAFTIQETSGLKLFQEKCTGCHKTDLFTDQTYRNNGLPINPRFNDNGRKRVTGLDEDYLKFKVPSLRNVEKSGPYMHDGRFSTLEAVLDFYESGVVESSTLDSILRKDGRLGIELSNKEKENLIAFLKTLTDNEFLNDKRFAEF